MPRRPPRPRRLPKNPARRKLYDGKGLRAIGKGTTLRNVALAAGSQANEANLRRIELKLIRRLIDQGEVYENFGKLGYTIERYCKGVIQATEAKRKTRWVYRGKIVTERTDIDWPARCAARDQYLRSTGIASLPTDARGDYQDPLEGLSNAELSLLSELDDEQLAELARSAAGGA